MISHSTAKQMSENITTDPAALNSFAMATTQESSSQVFVTCTISNVHPSAGSEARTQGTVRDLLVNGLDRTAKVTKIHELSEPITAQGYASRHCMAMNMRSAQKDHSRGLDRADEATVH